MWKFIDQILCEFRKCFSRQASFEWFVIIVIGCMIRSDAQGITTLVRDLYINPELYTTMLEFFRANSWNIDAMITCWVKVIKKFAPIHKVDGYTILIGDGVKQSKEGKKMPAVKKLYQESENSSKPNYMYGHMFGCIGVLAGNVLKMFCIPISLRLHDGLDTINTWKGTLNNSHVVQTIIDGFEVAKTMGKSILALDRYYLTVPGLEKLNNLTQKFKVHLDIITKSKKNCTAYEEAPPYKGRGRPPKKGPTVKIMNLFEKKELFRNEIIELYGKKENVSYYCINLLWGKKLYKKLRFVLVEYSGCKSILASTNLELDPIKMVIGLKLNVSLGS